jgi:predicted DNA-binding transcriptional regulator YafY
MGGSPLAAPARSQLDGSGLAERLKTSRWTMHHDIEALREAGVPVVATRGLGDGFRLADGYHTRLPLTSDEVAPSRRRVGGG